MNRIVSLPDQAVLRLAIISGICLVAAQLRAGIFEDLHDFGTPLGDLCVQPAGGIVFDTNGTFYGTAAEGGTDGFGGIYYQQTNGFNNVLWNFTGHADGAVPTGDLVLSGGTLYGTTLGGGASDGSVYKINTDGSGFTVLHDFSVSDGASPVGGLVLSGNVLYGVTEDGGSAGSGVIFKVNIDGSGFAVLKTFTARDSVTYTNVDGAFPEGGLILAGGTLFGTASVGGPNDCGTVFSTQTNGAGFEVIHAFNQTDGYQPRATLLALDGALYGTTYYGGSNGRGVVFTLNPDGSGFADLHPFASDGSEGTWPEAGLVAIGQTLYGTANSGGGSADDGSGTVFSLNSDGSNFTVLHEFDPIDPDYEDNNDGAGPAADLAVYNDTLYGTAGTGGPFEYTDGGTIFQLNPDGSDFYVNYAFDTTSYSNDGTYPETVLADGGAVFYGITYAGGLYGLGDIFKVNRDGTGFAILRSFSGMDGDYALNSLVLSGSKLYGTTQEGGVHYAGNIFSLNTDGTGFTNLYSFTGTNDGALTYGAPALAGNVLYGATAEGGTNGSGTIWRIGVDGSNFQVLHSFAAGEGSACQAGLLVSGGTLYGEAYNGGNGNGTLFKIETDGTGFTVLRNFSLYSQQGPQAEGANPEGGLILGGGTLYGTSYSGGDNHTGNIFKINTDGTGYASLWSFEPLSGGTYGYNANGARPQGGLVLVNGLLYGVTSQGSPNGMGTLFVVSTNANSSTGFTNLHNFGSSTEDGQYPGASLIFNGGALYGTSYAGGDYDYGMVYGYLLVPPLMITNSAGNPLVFWQNDGANHVLQSATNLATPLWLAAPAVNWTNYPYIGLQLTNGIVPSAAYFRLQE